jgi:hypothetical protein
MEGFILSNEEKVVEFALFDLMGKEIALINGSVFEDRSTLPPSIYIIHAKTKEGTKVAKWWSGY